MNKRCKNPNCESKGALLPISEFHKNKSSKTGHRSECKKCTCKKQRVYRQTFRGKEVHRGTDKRYKQGTGKIQHRLISLAYYHKNNVTVRSLRNHILPHEDCTNCNCKQLHHSMIECDVVNGVENINHCPIFQEWKHSGILPPQLTPHLLDEDYYSEDNDYLLEYLPDELKD